MNWSQMLNWVFLNPWTLALFSRVKLRVVPWDASAHFPCGEYFTALQWVCFCLCVCLTSVTCSPNLRAVSDAVIITARHIHACFKRSGLYASVILLFVFRSVSSSRWGNEEELGQILLSINSRRASEMWWSVWKQALFVCLCSTYSSADPNDSQH